LLAEIEQWLWRQGAEAIYLETPVDDEGAKVFYDKHGYFVFDRFERYYNNSLDAFVMMKTASASLLRKSRACYFWLNVVLSLSTGAVNES